MPDKVLSVTITAKDGASATFKAVGNAAKSLGETLEEAGKSSTGFAAAIAKNEQSLNTLGKAMVGVGGVLSAAFIAPMALGAKAAWNQVDAVQKATTALRAYEQDASKVNKVLAELVAYARSPEGVLFQRQDLFAAAQGLRVAGAETENLTRYVEIMSRSVATGMTSWNDLTQVLQRVGSTGQLTGIDFDNLTKAGFQLDESLRNQKVSWDELFSALDRGIPGIGSYLDTIQGQSIRLASSLRDLGIAFLDIDKQTSQFKPGGLGDQIYQGFGQARDVLISMQPAAAALGTIMATSMTATKAVAGSMQTLGSVIATIPGPLRLTASAFDALGVSGHTAVGVLGAVGAAALTMGGAFLLALPRIVATKNALRDLGGVQGILSGLGRLGAGGLSGLLGMLAGPAGVAAAAAIAVAGVGLLSNHLAGELPEASKTAEATIDALIEQVINLGATLALTPQMLQLDDITRANNELIELTNSSADAVSDAIDAMNFYGAGSKEYTEALAAIPPQIREVIDANHDAVISHQELFDFLHGGSDQLVRDSVAMNQFLENNADTFFKIYTAIGAGADEARRQLGLLFAELGQISPDHAQIVLDTIVRSLSVTGQAALLAGQHAKTGAEGFYQAGVTISAAQQNWHRVASAMAADAMHMGDAVRGGVDLLNEHIDVFALRTINHLDDVAISMTELGRLSVALGPRTDLRGLTEQTLAFDQTIKQTKADAQAAADALFGMAAARQSATELTGASEIGEGMKKIGESAKAAADQVKDAYAEMTAAYRGPVDALDAGYSAVVKTTDAIAKQSQDVADWAENLIAAEGVYSKLDDLVAAGRITGQSGVFTGMSEYAQAQQAYNSIIEDNAAIQDHVLTIQAKQAPMLAEMESNLEAYLGTLADASPEQQAFALAMMDSATSSQTLDIAMGLIENRDVFGPMAESVANLNPYLGEALVQMGLMTKVKDDVTGEWRYELVGDGADTALSQTQELTKALEALNRTFTAVFSLDVQIAKNTQFFDENGFVPERLLSSGLEGGNAKLQINITADDSQVRTTIDTITGTAIPDKTMMVLGDNSAAMSAVDATNLRTIDSKMLEIGGENNAALNAIDAVNNAAVYDKTMTINVITAYSTIGSLPVYAGIRHGGVAGYAHGGIIAELAENGPELLYLAGGGTVPVYDRGLYSVPPGTYVSPANTRSVERSGPSVVVSFDGATFNGTSRSDMRSWANEEFIPSLRRVLQDERIGLPT